MAIPRHMGIGAENDLDGTSGWWPGLKGRVGPSAQLYLCFLDPL